MNEVVIPDLPSELAHDWYGVLTWLIIGFVVAFVAWVWYDRKAFRQRLTDIEDDLAELKAVLKAERDGHAQTHLARTQQPEETMNSLWTLGFWKDAGTSRRVTCSPVPPSTPCARSAGCSPSAA